MISSKRSSEDDRTVGAERGGGICHPSIIWELVNPILTGWVFIMPPGFPHTCMISSKRSSEDDRTVGAVENLGNGMEASLKSAVGPIRLE